MSAPSKSVAVLRGPFDRFPIEDHWVTARSIGIHASDPIVHVRLLPVPTSVYVQGESAIPLESNAGDYLVIDARGGHLILGPEEFVRLYEFPRADTVPPEEPPKSIRPYEETIRDLGDAIPPLRRVLEDLRARELAEQVWREPVVVPDVGIEAKDPTPPWLRSYEEQLATEIVARSVVAEEPAPDPEIEALERVRAAILKDPARVAVALVDALAASAPSRPVPGASKPSARPQARPVLEPPTVPSGPTEAEFVQEFRETQLIVDPAYRTSARDIYHRYVRFAGKRGHEPTTEGKFNAELLLQTGWKMITVRGQLTWDGVTHKALVPKARPVIDPPLPPPPPLEEPSSTPEETSAPQDTLGWTPPPDDAPPPPPPSIPPPREVG